MTNQKNILESVDKASLAKHLAVGAVVGFAVISFFVFGVDRPKPEWGTFWRVRPLIVTPLSGAAGGAVFYFLGFFGSRLGWPKAISIVLAAIISIVGLWMGIVLGLVGTMWN